MIKTIRLLTVAATLAAATLPLMAQAPAASASAAAPVADDPHLWLEDVLGDKALAWVRERNAESQGVLQARPRFGRAHV